MSQLTFLLTLAPSSGDRRVGRAAFARPARSRRPRKKWDATNLAFFRNNPNNRGVVRLGYLVSLPWNTSDLPELRQTDALTGVGAASGVGLAAVASDRFRAPAIGPVHDEGSVRRSHLAETEQTPAVADRQMAPSKRAQRYAWSGGRLSEPCAAPRAAAGVRADQTRWVALRRGN